MTFLCFSLLAATLVPAPRTYVELSGECRLTGADFGFASVRDVKDSMLPPEGYRIDITTSEVVVASSDAAGAFYARQTLRQMARVEGADAFYGCARIEDSPAFRWRGVHFDDCRHFFGKETLKKTLDLMAQHKMNVLHWHLTEDQGWRLEVPGYPELVKYGAVRPASLVHRAKRRNSPDENGCLFETDGCPYGPFFYSEADVREIVDYAAARHILVVPEIELPGHVFAALAAYPEFACRPERLARRHPRIEWGIEKDVLCLGNDRAIKFMEDVLDYVCRLFPSKFVHIGGDECPTDRWKECPKCQARIKAEGLSDEKGLQPWITRHFVRFLEKRGKRAVGWDEYLNGDVPISSVGMYWRSLKACGAGHDRISGAAAAEKGHDMVMCPFTETYFFYGQDLEDDPLEYGKGHQLSLRKVYEFDPLRGVSEQARKHVLGGQCCNWSEYTWNVNDLEWKLWPRACAMAETLWLGNAKPGYDDFYARMRIHRRRLLRAGVHAAPLPPYEMSSAADPTGAVEFDVQPPDNPHGAVVRAADFGVSETSTNNSPALQAAIIHCKKTGAAKLVLEKGRYRFTSDGKIDFAGLRDFEFDGGGSDFVFFHKKGPNLQFQSCRRIVVRNFSIDWDWEKDPLGSIVEIAEKDDKSVTFRFVDYEDFPRKDIRCAFMSPWDKEAREVGCPDMGNGFSIDMAWGGAAMPHPPREWLSGNLLRVEKGIDYHFVKKGALFRMMHYYYDMHNVIIANTSHLRMEDVEVKSNPGHAFIVDGTTHHCHFRNVNIRLPKDDLKRGVTCTADHFHVNRSQGFLKFENCEFSLGGDDCMNLHDCSLHAPIRLDDHTLRVKLRSRRPFDEDDLVELRHGNFKPTGIVCKVKTKTNEEGGYDITFPVKLPESEWEGFVLFDRTSRTHNIILRNCWFHGNRSRGLILQASDVTMENCRISHTEGCGMILSTGWTHKLWCEGSGVSNVVVRNCRFDHVNVAHGLRNGIVADVVMDSYARWPGHAPKNGYPVFRNILLENNVFTDPSGYIVSVREGSGVVFRNNKVVMTFRDRFAPEYRGQVRADPPDNLTEENTVRLDLIP